MKTVYSNAELPHIWVHNGQHEARNGNDSMSFNGDNFYSYSTIIAERHGNVILMSSRVYSKTTSKHQCLIRRAARGEIVYCYNVNYSPRDNFEHLEEVVLRLVEKQTRAKKIDYISQAEKLIDEFKRYADLLGYKMPADTVNGIVKVNEAARKKAEAARKKAEAARKKEIRAFKKSIDIKRIERAYNIARKCFHSEHLKWYKIIMNKIEMIATKARIHGIIIPLKIYPDLMRVTRDNNIITSRGVNITRDEARGLFLALKKGENVIGYRVSHYRIDEINGDYVKAGCHTFPRDEVGYISRVMFGEAV